MAALATAEALDASQCVPKSRQVPQTRGRRIFLPIRREAPLVKDGDLQVVRNLSGY